MKHFYSLILLFICFNTLLAQEGTIRGTIHDKTTGEVIMFANVLVLENSLGETSDLDGNYELSLEEGTYTLEFSYVGYQNLKVEGVSVKANEISLVDVNISESSEILETVVVTAKQVQNTAAAINTLKRKSINLLDGLSSQTFKRTGDSDASAAVKRVTGVSIEGGKYVYVRGLGDRYSKTTLNGLELPGLDPDRNTVQMDVFSTNILDNILVYKTFSPNLQGDFSGGLVNIVLKDFPEEKSMNISAGMAYNPNFHLNENYLTYEGGKTDWLGMDDGTRALAIDPRVTTDIPSPSGASLPEKQKMEAISNSFSNTLGAIKQKSGLNHKFSFDIANQFKLKKGTLGALFATSYSRSFQFFENVEYNRFLIPQNNIQSNELLGRYFQKGSYGQDEVFWNLFGGIAYKNNKHKIGLYVLQNQNATSKAGQFTRDNVEGSDATISFDNLEYQERSVSTLILQGKSVINDDFSVEWAVTPTFSTLDEPDIRSTGFDVEGENYIFPTTSANAVRIFRNMEETNYTAKVDLTHKINVKNKKGVLKTGFYGTTKERNYRIDNYTVGAFPNLPSTQYLGDANLILNDENRYSVETGIGTYIRGSFQPSNVYAASQTILAAYAMAELPITKDFKVITGARLENTTNNYTGQNQSGTRILNDSTVLKSFDILPSLNMVYNLSDNQNLRLSANKTLARPSFKEISFAQIQDYLSGITFIGNIEIKKTDVYNLDLRYEFFGTSGQNVSISSFYKRFLNPIEMVAFNEAAPNNITPRNIDNADLAGVEFDIKKNLSFVNIPNLTIGANMSMIYSNVKRSEVELNSKRLVARDREDISETRQMVGQSPMIINAIVGYNNIDKGIEANIAYNVQGEKLVLVGIGANPDVYEKSFHSLNIRLAKSIGLNKNWKVSLSADNLLNSKRQKVNKSFNASDRNFELFQPGTTFSLSLGYSL